MYEYLIRTLTFTRMRAHLSDHISVKELYITRKMFNDKVHVKTENFNEAQLVLWTW
jgi:hypothetical protein